MKNDHLDVSLRDLPPVTVIFTYRAMDIPAGEFNEHIARGFHAIKELAVRYGHDASIHKVIGVPHVSDGRLTGYDCCAEVPADVEILDAVQSRRLEGGRYAVLTLEKNPATIGPAIDRFFSRYVPEHHVQIDGSRLGYEVYADRAMELCTPIM